MKGKFYIDGKDAYSVHGLFVANNGYNGLISFPGFKELDEMYGPNMTVWKLTYPPGLECYGVQYNVLLL